MKCPRCQQDNASEQKFCGECGTPLRAVGSTGVPAPSYANITSVLSEALEQQTATSEILRAISSTQQDVQPVFDTIVQSAVRLCHAASAAVFRVEGGLIHEPANYGLAAEKLAATRARYPRPLDMDSTPGIAILTRSVFHVPDTEDAATIEHVQQTGRLLGIRSLIAVPMLYEANAVGAIVVTRHAAGPFSDADIELLRTFTDQAVIAIENVQLFKELQEKNEALTQAHAQTSEALEQQTATSEILGVISSSPTDVQPTFEAIARSARRLCDAAHGMVFRFDGELIHLVAHDNLEPQQLEAVRSIFPIPPGRQSVTARAILTGALVHVRDRRDDPELDYGILSANFPATLAVPLLRDRIPLGAITVTRAEARLFSEREIGLLKTFADQAVIAIENVRLFNETKEALEQQTATSEILRVIARSPTDLQPVLDELVENAGRLCQSAETALLLVAGEQLRVVATSGYAVGEASGLSHPIHRGWVAGRAVADASTVHVEDLANAEAEFPLGREIAIRFGHRTALATPLLREGTAIGAFFLRRREVRQFSDKEITLLQTFADQAVIAIENVRLFRELEARNSELTAALDQQTATSDVLRAIAHTQTDAQPVFDTIVRSAVRLCQAANAAVFVTDGRMLYHPANYGSSQEVLAAVRVRYPRPLDMKTTEGIAVLTRSVIHVPDTEDPSAMEGTRQSGRLIGFRSVVTVPMLREDDAVGAILVTRRQPGAFSGAEIELLKTFTDQAAIAIENVRMFTELQSRNRELTDALARQTATSEILRVISSSPTDVQPVFDSIARNAVTLCGGIRALVLRFDGVMLHIASHHNMSADGVDRVERAFPRRPGRDYPPGRAFVDRSVVHVPDLQAAIEFSGSTARQRGVGSMLAVPLLREQEAVGVISLARDVIGPFAAEEIAVLQTFADQAVIAIENVRLFAELQTRNREVENKSRQLEVASQHKSEFLANMSHELRTPLNAIIGFSEVLGERLFGELNEKQEEYLKDIHASGQHLLSLINDILDLSKIEAGRMELELAEFHLPQAIENALVLVRERAVRRGITLEQSIDSRLGEIQGDERKIKQVLLNLLSNAIKFTPEGGRIEIRAKPVEGSVEISVSDTGVGIAPEDQEAIFEEFRQVGTAAKKVEGTGLGLALSRKFIELHGGRIWVTSQVEVGSTFTFTIPCTVVNE